MRRRRLQQLDFRSASRNENGKRVTLSVPALCTAFNLDRSTFVQGRKFILTVEGVESFWYVNRDQRTLTTKGFPAKLDRPRIGNNKTYGVSSNVRSL